MIPKLCKGCNRPDYEHYLNDNGLVCFHKESSTKFKPEDNLEYLEAVNDVKWLDNLINEIP